jgi:hypothetical protein
MVVVLPLSAVPVVGLLRSTTSTAAEAGFLAALVVSS